MKLIKGRKYFQNSITYKCTVSSGIEVNNDRQGTPTNRRKTGRNGKAAVYC